MTSDPAPLPARLSTLLRSLSARDRLTLEQVSTLTEAVEALSPRPLPEEMRNAVPLRPLHRVATVQDAQALMTFYGGKGWEFSTEAALARLVLAQDAELTQLRARAEAEREALAWYGEQARLCRLIHSEGDAGRHALNADGGQRALAALAPAPAQEPEKGA